MSARRRPISREEQIIRKREKEYQHQKFWDDQQKYYDWWGKNNTKYEEWTSPRYYDTNTQLAKQRQMEKFLLEKKELRRNKLKKLFDQEKSNWEIELMKQKEEEIRSPRSPRERPDDIPTEILKEVYQGIKEKEEEKRRKESELKLYHHWRNNNSFINDYEKSQRTKDLKYSWLHQQMEKRRRKEREHAEEKRLILEREERFKLEKEKEEEERKNMERRNKELKEVIDKQIEEVKMRQTVSEKLREKEEEERKRKMELAELEERQKRLEATSKQKEISLYNIKQYKTKLQQKMRNIQENLHEQEKLMKRLKDLDIAEKIENDQLKEDIKIGIEEFLKISKEQKKLEKLREKHLQFLFDSEAQSMYEKQCKVWNSEEEARKKLIKDVFSVLSEQIENNYKKSREEQENIIKERETLIKMTEEYNEELIKLKEEERKKQLKRKEELDLEVKKKEEMKKSLAEEDKLKKITEELERAKIEEERLKREIMNLHRGHGLYSPHGKSNITF